MPGYLMVMVCLFSAFWTSAATATEPWRLTAAAAALSKDEKQMIGKAVCGDGGYEETELGLKCSRCPGFTGRPGADEGLQIVGWHRGRFTSADSEMQWLLDTDGCEAHYQSFGGAILLVHGAVRSLPALPMVALGSSLAAKAGGGALKLLFYKPGFRLNDCLAFATEKSRTQLVCNEADMAQGEVIGHISAMEVTRRGITRWRLLRWYDNSGSEMPEVVSVMPVSMRRAELGEAQPALKIQVKLTATTRERYEQDPQAGQSLESLMFKHKERRFFATPKTQQVLEQIGVLTRKMLE